MTSVQKFVLLLVPHNCNIALFHNIVLGFSLYWESCLFSSFLFPAVPVSAKIIYIFQKIFDKHICLSSLTSIIHEEIIWHWFFWWNINFVHILYMFIHNLHILYMYPPQAWSENEWFAETRINTVTRPHLVYEQQSPMSGLGSWSAQIHQKSCLRILAAVVTLSFAVCECDFRAITSLRENKNSSELLGDLEFLQM